MRWYQKILLRFSKFLCYSCPIKLFQNLYEKLVQRYLVLSLVQPIRRALEYQNLGRKLLMVDELPQGAYARYQNELNQTVASIQSNLQINTPTITYPNPPNTPHTITTPTSTAPNFSDYYNQLISSLESHGTFDFNGTYASYNPIENCATQEHPLTIEENILNNYLIKIQEVKEEKFNEEKRMEMSNAISSLEL